MKRFTFRLEPVLKNRSQKEEKAILAQSLAQKEYWGQMEKLEGIRASLEDIIETGINRATAQECLARSLYIDFLQISKEKQEGVVDLALRNLEKKRNDVIQARKDKLVLQKLKEKLFEGYTLELNKWEAKINDDQCMALANRRKGG